MQFAGKQCHLRSGTGRESHALGHHQGTLPEVEDQESEKQGDRKIFLEGFTLFCSVFLRKGLRQPRLALNS